MSNWWSCLEDILPQNIAFPYFEKSYSRACYKLQLELSRENNVVLGNDTTSCHVGLMVD